jgi:small subunit ribosomal protein S5
MKPRDRVRRDDDADSKRDLSLWVPRTDLGRKVKSGEIKTMQQVIELAIPIKEVEVVDKLIPDMSEEIINVGRVQRVTDSGRRMRFRVVMSVGNKNGYVGVGEATGKEAGPTIRKAIERAKLNIKEVKRGCGSWECGCGAPHTVPFKVDGDGGSVRVSLSPAPKGTGLVSGEIARKILALAGIKDVWVHTLGHTRTNINFAHAVVDALVNTNNVKIGADQIKNLGVISGLSTVKEDGKVQEVTN